MWAASDVEVDHAAEVICCILMPVPRLPLYLCVFRCGVVRLSHVGGVVERWWGGRRGYSRIVLLPQQNVLASRCVCLCFLCKREIHHAACVCTGRC